MATLILDAEFEEQLLAQRRAFGHDRFDEVWDGVYVITAPKCNEHQRLATKLSFVLASVEEDSDALLFAGCNLSDRREDWEMNYRCPDVAMFLANNSAQNLNSHWFGGPDLAIEVVSHHDKSWDKLDFYAAIQTQELLIIDRDPWKLSLLRLAGEKLVLAVESTPAVNIPIASAVVPISFHLIPRENDKPLLEVRHLHDGRRWSVDPVIRGW